MHANSPTAPIAAEVNFLIMARSPPLAPRITSGSGIVRSRQRSQIASHRQPESGAKHKRRPMGSIPHRTDATPNEWRRGLSPRMPGQFKRTRNRHCLNVLSRGSDVDSDPVSHRLLTRCRLRAGFKAARRYATFRCLHDRFSSRWLIGRLASCGLSLGGEHAADIGMVRVWHFPRPARALSCPRCRRSGLWERQAKLQALWRRAALVQN